MITTDSNFSAIPWGSMISYNKEFFEHAYRKDKKTNERHSVLRLKPKIAGKCLGLYTIILDKQKNEVQISVSSKILQERYLEHINKDTLLKSYEILNTMGLIQVRPLSAAENSTPLRIHPCMSPLLSKPFGVYTNDLGIISKRSNYYITSFERTGLDIRSSSRSNKRRFIIYDLFLSMSLAKNARLLSYLPIENFQGRVRLEFNLENPADIRWAWGLLEKSELNLMELLESPKQILFDCFNEVLNANLLPSFPVDISDPSIGFDELQKELGMLDFARRFPEKKQGIAFIRSKYPSSTNPSEQIKRYKIALDTVAADRLFQDFSNIDEIKTLLQTL